MAVSRLHPAPPTQHHQHQHQHHHHIASTLMSCVRESSPVEELEEATEDSAGCGGVGGGGAGGAEGRKQGRHESKKRRFHPLRGLRRIFRRKSRRAPGEGGDQEVLPPPSSAIASSSSLGGTLPPEERRDSGTAYGDFDEAYRSRSASELLSGEEEEEEEEVPGENGRRRGSGGIASGEIFQDSLRHSVSHDSVFSSGERRAAGSGGGSGGGGRPTQPLAPSSSAQQVAAHQGVREELFDAVRRRRSRGRSKDKEDENDGEREVREAAAAARSSDDEEDLGLPRSPCNSPSSGEAGLRSDQKEIQSKSHSTCSEGSLLSMGSSDMDEDSQGHFSGHSSKLSLHEKSSSQFGSDLELDVGATAEPLSHSAARHKMSVRPKRTHGAPRLRRLKEVTSLGSLPTTPEVNEDSGRCSSPEISFNQETSSTEHIQMPSDNPHLKSASIPSAGAVEMPQRVSQSRQNAANSKSDSPLSCLPESYTSSPKPFLTPIPDPSPGNDRQEAKLLEFSDEDGYSQQIKLETYSPKNASESRGWGDESMVYSDADNRIVDEIVGMEETDNGGTTLLSRLLSWRGSKKKIDEPLEGATAAVEGAPSRRMDVHGRYVHEVICETETVSGSTDHTPPSPGWRPGPFSTSWPPLLHSTPRSFHTSSRHIPPGTEERGNTSSEEAMCSEWVSDFSGPHSLPLIMQGEAMELMHEKVNINRSEVNRQIFESAPGAFPVNLRTKLPLSQSEAPIEVALLKSSSFKVYRQEQQHVFASQEAPESLPVKFERSEFDADFPVSLGECLIKVDSNNVDLTQKESPPKETFLMSSVEGLLTLDVSGPSEVNPCDMAEEERCGEFSVEAGGTGGGMDDWVTGQRGGKEEILFNSYILIPEDSNVGVVDNLESKVMLQHTKLECADEDIQCTYERSNDLIKEEDIFEPMPTNKVIEAHTPSEDQVVPATMVSSNASRYKRTQSMPLSPSSPKSSEVPEFLRVQLIHVDSRPATNVVLHSTGGIPVSVNLPESCDMPGRRRLRPRSADGLEINQSGTKEFVGVLSTSKSRITDVISTVDNEKIGSATGFTVKEKEVLNDGRCKVSTRESLEIVIQNEDSRPKEISLPSTVQQKVSEDISDKTGSTRGTPLKEKDESIDHFYKTLSRESLEVAVQNEDNRHKETSLSSRTQRKVSEDMNNKIGSVTVMSLKEKEDVRCKASVRESLGLVAVQNDDNRPKDACLPPRAQRKVSEESVVEVVPRRKSTSSRDLGSHSKDDEPELFKVFARRSLKLKDSETWDGHPPTQQQQRSRDSDKENDIGDLADVVILPVGKEQKQREPLVKSEFLREVDHPVKPSVTPQHFGQLQRLPSSNGLLPPTSVNSGNNSMQSNSIYSGNSNEKAAVIGSENPKIHRSSVTGGSLPRREGPSPEKRPRGVSVNIPPESHPIRVETNRGAGISCELRRPSWATQIHSEESYGKPIVSEVAEVCRQPVELGFEGEEDAKPHFKRIQQRKEEWELRARMQ